METTKTQQDSTRVQREKVGLSGVKSSRENRITKS